MPIERVPDFTYVIAEMMGQMRRRGLISPIYLGGVSGSGGGIGTSPGGFIGRLIQSKVAYDTSELNTNTSGSTSLVDNLDHIRARSTMVWPMWNRSGGLVAQGQVVVIDSANTESFKNTTTLRDPTFLGVVRIGSASGSQGFVTFGGYAPLINVDGTTSIGNYLTTSNQSGKARAVTAGSTSGIFGMALSSGSPQVSGIIFPGKSVY